jgi:hypothetical protein
MLATIAYTGMRWGETIGLEPEFVLPALINVEWQLHEIKDKRGHSSYMSVRMAPTSPEPRRSPPKPTTRRDAH